MVGVGIGRISGWNINKQIIIEMEVREFSYMDNGRKLCFRVGQSLSFTSRGGGLTSMVIHSIKKERLKNRDKITIHVREKDGNEAVVWKEIYRHDDGSLTIDVSDYEKELERD